MTATPEPERGGLTPEASLRALYEVAVAVGGLRDPVAVARVTVEHAQRLLAVDGAVVYAHDPATGRLFPLYETRSAAAEPPLQPGEGAIGQAFARGRPVRVADYRGWKDAVGQSQRRGMVSALAVPLVTEQRTVGAAGVWTYARRRFGKQESQLLQLLAAHVAPALEAARLSGEAEAKAEMFEALHEVAVVSAGVLDPEALARTVVDRAAALLGCEGAGLWWWEDRRLRRFATRGTPEELDYRPREGAVGVAFAERRVVTVDDYQAWPQAVERIRERGVRATVAVPLMAGNRAVGALAAWTSAERTFDPEDGQKLALLAAQVAPALNASRLASEREAQAELFEALNDLARGAGGLLDPDRLAALTVDRARQLFRVHSAALLWLSPDGASLVRLADNDAGGRLPERIPAGEGASGRALAGRKPVIVADYPEWEHAVIRDADVRSVAAVPLIVGDRALGAVVVRAEARDFFGAEKVAMLELLAAQVAPALAAASLHADLVASEHRFRSLFETIACGVLVQRPGGVVVDANRAAEEIFGLTLEEMAGHPSADLWQVDDHSARPALMALETRRPIRNHVFRVHRRDGSVRWLQADSIPVLDGTGRAVQVVSSLIDVTEQRRAQEALRESEEVFRAVFDRAGIGICRIDLEGVIQDANPALVAMLGYTRDQVVGRPATTFVHEEDLRDSTLVAVAGGEAAFAQAEIRCLRRDGSVMWGNAVLTPVYDRSGEVAFLIGMIEDVTARKAQEAALAHQALHDTLTDLPNRALLQDRLHHAIRIARRDRHRLALLMMDLDRFKEVNDTFGHHSGDLLLRDVASRLRGELRSSDTVARLGGDEFAILLGHVEEMEGAATTARKLLHALEGAFRIEGEDVGIGASIGIAIYPDHGADADLLMRHADVAMYLAKRSGSGYALYAADADQHTPGRLAMINDLRGAVERGELELHYQPKLDVRTREPAGVEALVRWRHPRLGLLLPEQFIGLAEHTGLIRPVGLWVIGEAIRQAAEWRAAGRRLPVAVNLSMRNIHDPQLPAAFERLLEEHSVAPGSLQVEITESTLMADPDYALRVVSRLAELGVELAIDDFGTGYSSLAYLKRLPVSEIKIDRSFVIDMPAEENAAVIVRSTIDLGHNLGLMVCAEGVESEQVFAMVEQWDCNLAQGNWICPAVPADQLPDSLGARARAGD